MRFIWWTLFALAIAVAGCATGEMISRSSSSGAENSSLDVEIIANCADRMEKSMWVMQKLQASTRPRPDFLLPRDHDLLECSLAEYLLSRRELEQIAERQQLPNPELSQLSHRLKTEHDVRVAS